MATRAAEEDEMQGDKPKLNCGGLLRTEWVETERAVNPLNSAKYKRFQER